MKSLRTTSFILMSVILLQTGYAGVLTKNTITDSKTWSRSFKVNADALLNLSCRQADVKISTWDQNQIDVEVTLMVEAYDEEDLQAMFKEFEPGITGSAKQVDVVNPNCFSEITTGSKTRIKINNQVFKVKSYRYHYRIKMPKTNDLNSKVRFSDLELGEHRGKLDLELYECTLKASEVNVSEANMNIKFSSGTLGSAKSFVLKTYESDLIFDSTSKLSMEARFSNIKFNQALSANVLAYESDLDLGTTHDVKLKHNFGSFKISTAHSLELDGYEMKLEAERINHLSVPDGRFSKVSVGQVSSLSPVTAYESKFFIAKADSISISSKFCKLQVGTLNSRLDFKAYESNLDIMTLQSGYSAINIDAKFSKANIALGTGTGYELDAEINFGEVSVPEADRSQISIFRDGNSRKAKGYSNGGANSPKITVRGYETEIALSR